MRLIDKQMKNSMARMPTKVREYYPALIYKIDQDLYMWTIEFRIRIRESLSYENYSN